MNTIEVQGNTVVIQGHPGRTFRCASRQQAGYLASLMETCYNAGREEVLDNIRWKCGWLFNKNSWWAGVHYSRHNRRWCINLLPCVTFWITKPGGRIP